MMNKINLQLSLKIMIIWLVLFSGYARAQLSGTYTIGGEGSDFTDFADAVQALKYDGIGGDVGFLVTPGTYYNVSMVDIENSENYKIQFIANGSVNDTVFIAGQLLVRKTNNVSFNGFTMYPQINQTTSCIFVDESNDFLLKKCYVLNLFNNNFGSGEALVKMEFPWVKEEFIAEIDSCKIYSEDETIRYSGENAKVFMRNSYFTGTFENMMGDVETEYISNVFHFTDYWLNNNWQTFRGNTIYYEGIGELFTKGNLLNNVFHCAVNIGSGSIRKNTFYGDVHMSHMIYGYFYGNTVFGAYDAVFCHGMNVISNTFYGGCRLNNNNTKFGNNFAYDTVTFTHGPAQKICNNNFSNQAHLSLHFVSGEMRNNNLNTFYAAQPQVLTISDNNFINPSGGNITSYGENAHFVDPMYAGDSVLYAENPVLIAKGTGFFSLLNFDKDSVPRKDPCTIGANEICFDWQPGEISIPCGDSLCLDLCLDSLENMYWSPSFLFPDSTATSPMIFPENPVTVYLHLPDGAVYDSLVINTESFDPVALAAYSSDGLTVSFENQSICADEYSWDFGDGHFSKAESPVHVYPAYGNYLCELTAYNNVGSSKVTILVQIIPTSVNCQSLDGITLYPNPAGDLLKIDSDIPVKCAILTSMSGKVLLTREFYAGDDYQLNLKPFDEGIYLLKIITGSGVIVKKVMKVE